MKNLYSLCFGLFLLTTVVSINAQPVSQTFNTSGTYTIPTGYSANLTIEAWGAGAGGGAGNGAKGGGGGGAYASATTTLLAGSYTITVGTGGANTGTNGGNSSFTTIVIAEGGFSTTTGTGGAGGTTAGSTGTILVAGTVGANSSGNNGGAGGAGANGGGGGTAGVANNGVGGAGTAPGGGGGGKAGPGNDVTGGGIGGNGRVIVTVNTVLPVKLSNIKVFEKQSGIQIDWVAYSEENLSKYKIERSADGVQFISIGEVTARNVTTISNYGFFDANPLPGVSFYRLLSIDLDGRFGYSRIVKMNLDRGNKAIAVYPNPVIGGYVSLQTADLAKGNYTIQILSASSQQVYSQRFTHTGGSLTQTIQLPATIKSGMYTMQLDNDGVKVMSKIISVQ